MQKISSSEIWHRPYFINGEHKNLLSTCKSCSTETGPLPNFHEVYSVATGGPLIFRLAKKFSEQHFLPKSCTKLSPGGTYWVDGILRVEGLHLMGQQLAQ